MERIASLVLVVLSAFFLTTRVAALDPGRPDFQTITFPSGDELPVTADVYLAHDRTAPFIVLFHQAGWSRGEYREIAPKLNAMGFNCMAVDQRSGGSVNGVTNETAAAARKKKAGTGYVDALPDIRAALAYARSEYARGKLIAWGSSYSAGLVLRLAGEEPDSVDGVLAFAPGEYFGKQGKSATWVTEAAAKIDDPAFITSAKSEKGRWETIYAAIPKKYRNRFVPKTAGNHGSRALWKKFDDSEDYWEAVSAFLEKVRK